MNKTAIDWADWSWNPIVGCSFGCKWCYARRFAERGLGEYGKWPKGERFKPRFLPERLGEPDKVKRPSRIFLCSMADPFGPEIAIQDLEKVFSTMRRTPWHTYIALTKRPIVARDRLRRMEDRRYIAGLPPGIPAYLWLGVSLASDDDHERAWQLLKTPAAVRFISYEPMLGPLDLDRWELACKTWRKGATIGTYLDWVIVGAQTGPGAKPPEPEWIHSIVDQCKADNVPVFLKSNIAPYWDGKLIQEFPKE